jgi:pimeloyl-ACP methyl ester carboxylesterase
VPTLLVTGDSSLDRVVPVERTREYLRIWPHARHAVIPRTGHLGLITRPEEFAAVVGPFVGAPGEWQESHDGAAAQRARSGRRVG